MASANPEQREAILVHTGETLVLAGPGSGKTYVLTAHIETLLSAYQVDPSSILVLTFSKAAALSMRSRFYKSTEGRYPPISFGTFHSIFYQIIRMAGKSNTAVIAPTRRAGLLTTIMRQYFPELSPEEDMDLLASVITRSREQGYPAPQGDIRDVHRIADAVRMYAAYLSENRLIDYDGMILECRDLLRERPDILAELQSQYAFLLVDEFQDISAAQYEILRLLYDRKGDAPRALFVVGDDDQSIYGFRGADPAICRQFLADYPNARQIQLQINYRSLPGIVHAAGLVIAENRNRIAKRIVSGRKGMAGPAAVSYKGFVGKADQTQYLVDTVAAMDARTRRESAIICRTNRQLRLIRHALVRAGVIAGDGVMDENPWIARVRSLYDTYMEFGRQLRANAIERETYERIRNVPERYLLQESMPESVMTRQNFLSVYAAGSPAAKAMSSLVELAEALQDLPQTVRVRYFRHVIGIEPYLMERAGHNELMEEQIREAFAALSQPANPQPTQDTTINQNADAGIALLTMHASKGLEYKNVYLPDLNEGIIPPRRIRSVEGIEEERRLFYVAMTRAKEHLELLYLAGDDLNPMMPTRFLLPLGIGPNYES